MTKTKLIQSPLRYPGGKTKALKHIAKYLPKDFSEYREPFVGGGSVFIYIKQKFPHVKCWINDLNTDLCCFWKTAQTNPSRLIEEIEYIKDTEQVGKALFQELTSLNSEELTEDERAIRFFVLNRITFSGTVEAGGFSEQSFHKRFTRSSIERLAQLPGLLINVSITNSDYSKLLNQDGDNVFIFLDPPYLSAKKSKLYGKKGILHSVFDHHKFARQMKSCHHRWLITYDDSPEVRENFDFAYLHSWEFQYGMNNYKQQNASKGKELIITNYSVSVNKEQEQLKLNLPENHFN